MVREIVKYGHPALREKAEDVVDFDEAGEILKDMYETMKKNDGIGLAGNQIAVLKKLVVIDLTPSGEDVVMFLINPEITYRSKRTRAYEEGCLSIPGVYAKVERPAVITVRAYMPDGKRYTFNADGLLATALQHEIDHLNGVLFIDHLTEDERKKVQPKLDRLIENYRSKNPEAVVL